MSEKQTWCSHCGASLLRHHLNLAQAKFSPIQASPHQTQELGFCDNFRADGQIKSCVSCEREHKYTEGKTNRFGREGLKRGEKPESRCSFWPLIPLLRKLKEKRWARGCWAGFHQHFTTASAEGGLSQALSTPYKETGKVKEDYKIGDVLRGSLPELSVFPIQVIDGLNPPNRRGLWAPPPRAACCLQY